MNTLQSYAVLTIRVFLGSYYLASGLNFFLRFFPQPTGTGINAEFIELITRIHLFDFVKILDVVAGSCLILNRLTPLMLILLFPVTVQILIYDLYTPNMFGLWTGGRNFLYHCALFFVYFRYYEPMFELHARRTPVKELGSVWRERLSWKNDGPVIGAHVLILIILVGGAITAYNLLSMRRFEYLAFLSTVVIVCSVLLHDRWNARIRERIL